MAAEKRVGGHFRLLKTQIHICRFMFLAGKISIFDSRTPGLYKPQSTHVERNYVNVSVTGFTERRLFGLDSIEGLSVTLSSSAKFNNDARYVCIN